MEKKERIELKAEPRTEQGRSAVRRLRGEGLIPAILYSRRKKSVPLMVKIRDLQKVLATRTGENVLIDLKYSDGKSEKVATTMLQDIQRDPVWEEILHLDFHQISLAEKLEVRVPVVAKGESPGVREGGVLEFQMREMVVKCLPTEIPQNVEVDISGLKIGDALHIKDIDIPKNLEVLQKPDDMVLTISAPTELKEEELAAAPPVAQTGPEVIGEKERLERREETDKVKEEHKKEKEEVKVSAAKKEKE